MATSAVSRITSKGQVTIPEPIRGALRLQPGDRLEWKTRENGVIELRRMSDDLDGLVGVLGEPRKKLTIDEMDAALKSRFARGENGQP